MEFKGPRTFDVHISDEDLLLAIDGELPAGEAARVARHLTACWDCRARRQEIEDAIAVYIRVHRRNLDPQIPPAAGPRALLKARLAEIAKTPPVRSRGLLGRGLPPLWAQVAAVAAIAALATVMIGRWNIFNPDARHVSRQIAVSVPNSSLTPGAAILTTSSQVCSVPNPNNRTVSATLQRRVLEEYGIPGSQAVAYEVDYLITPALGGADDIHNLWPQSYSQTVWNARVKDALEDRLRDLVCEGRLDLATAQRDISANWIDAYKKYFQTDRPLETERP
jgi:anti-sigma factor RsiW